LAKQRLEVTVPC